MSGLKEIYLTGSAALTDPALAAEHAIAGAQVLDSDGLGSHSRSVADRNRQQIARPRPD